MSKERLQANIKESIDRNVFVRKDKSVDTLVCYINQELTFNLTKDVFTITYGHGYEYLTKFERKKINVAIARYIVQEEALRNKKFYLRMKNPAISEFSRFLNVNRDYHECSIGNGIEDGLYQTKFTESDVEHLKEKIDGFSELLELFEKEYVED